jgi:hypothetical protein
MKTPIKPNIKLDPVTAKFIFFIHFAYFLYRQRRYKKRALTRLSEGRFLAVTIFNKLVERSRYAAKLKTSFP